MLTENHVACGQPTPNPGWSWTLNHDRCHILTREICQTHPAVAESGDWDSETNHMVTPNFHPVRSIRDIVEGVQNACWKSATHPPRDISGLPALVLNGRFCRFDASSLCRHGSEWQPDCWADPFPPAVITCGQAGPRLASGKCPGGSAAWGGLA